MDVVHTAKDLSDSLRGRRGVLVPTMGALHEGHLSLIDVAREDASRRGVPVAASIFVNPTQFNDPGDLESYPRPIEQDLARLEARGVDVVFVPSAEEVYPPDDPGAAPEPTLPDVGRLPGLEDRSRPGHFAGVCRVVSRLFDLFDPSASVFGEKDWQQTRVVSAMCAQQGRDVRILVAPTRREHDGVAMSSRNLLLSAADLPRAAGVIAAIRAAQAVADAERAIEAARQTMREADLDVEYAAIRDSETLLKTPRQAGEGPCRVLLAARLAGVRLLDNAPWPA